MIIRAGLPPQADPLVADCARPYRRMRSNPDRNKEIEICITSIKEGVCMRTLMTLIVIGLIFVSSQIHAQPRQVLFPSEIKDYLLKGYSERANPLLKQANFFQQNQNVSLIGRWANGSCWAVFVKDSIAYFGNGAYLEVADVSDPSNPVKLSKVLLPSTVQGIDVSGNYAYVANDNYGLRIIDISNKYTPYEVGFYDLGTDTFAGGALKVCVAGNYAYVAGGNDHKLRIFAVSSPSSPTLLMTYDTGDFLGNVAVSGSYAYLANNNGLRILNINNPSSPTEVGFYDTQGSNRHVFVSGNYAYLGDYGDGLRIIDVSNPASPTEVGYYNINNRPSAK